MTSPKSSIFDSYREGKVACYSTYLPAQCRAITAHESTMYPLSWCKAFFLDGQDTATCKMLDECLRQILEQVWTGC